MFRSAECQFAILPPIRRSTVTVAELAEYWAVSRQQIYKRIETGGLEAIRLGIRLYRIRRAALDYERRAGISPSPSELNNQPSKCCTSYTPGSVPGPATDWTSARAQSNSTVEIHGTLTLRFRRLWQAVSSEAASDPSSQAWEELTARSGAPQVCDSPASLTPGHCVLLQGDDLADEYRRHD